MCVNAQQQCVDHNTTGAGVKKKPLSSVNTYIYKHTYTYLLSLRNFIGVGLCVSVFFNTLEELQMSGIRKIFSLRRAPKVVVNPKDDLRQLDYICHDTKIFQNISDYQRQQIYPIRNVLIAKAKEVTPLSAKIKAIDDCVKENIELLVAKAISDKLEEFKESSTGTNAPIKKNGFFSFLSSSKSNDSQSQSLQQLSLLESAAPKGRPLLGSSQMQLILRLQLCKEYFTSLQSLLEKSEISNDALNGSSKLLGIVDAVLLGSASERVAMHLSLFDSKVYQHTLQTSFYSLYESEIQAVVRHLDKYPMQVKAHGKLLRKNTPSSYLLDTLELNTKARCILAWMGKKTFFLR